MARSPIRRAIGRLILALIRWTPVLEETPPAKCILVSARHTSNWDGFIMLAVAWALDLRIRWVLKAELCRPPHGWFLTGLGALPIERDGTMQVTDRLIQEFGTRDELLLAIAPAGTRKRTEHWRSGFYWIARGANVPMALGFVDYATRRAGLGPLLRATDDLTADMGRVRAFYADIRALRPQQESAVRLKDEGLQDAP